MNISDLETQAEFLAVKRELLRFASNRYAGFNFELRDRGFDEDSCRSGLEPARQLLRVDLVGTCGDVVIELNLEIRRRWAGQRLVVEQRSPERYTHGTGPTRTARIGHASVEIGNSYSSTEILDLGIGFDDVPRESPFRTVKDDFDFALVFVVRQLTKMLKDLGWRGTRVNGSEESDEVELSASGRTPSLAERVGPHDVARGRSGLEID